VAAVVSTYCPRCGERSPESHELTLRGLATQIFHALTSVDGKLLRTFALLFRRPGELTVAYLYGPRKPYIGPVPLYLMSNVLFFAAESLLGGAVFTTPLSAHLSTQPWSPLAATLLQERVAALGLTVEQFAPAFDRAVALHARSWIIAMALAFALLPWLVFHRRGKPAVVHAVFSLHLYSYLLLLLSVANVVPALAAWLGGPGDAWQALDNGIAVLLLLACALYMYVAAAKVYSAAGAARVVQVAVLTVGIGAIVLGYRFALFLLTLYTTP
jgi:hypothetical protein